MEEVFKCSYKTGWLEMYRAPLLCHEDTLRTDGLIFHSSKWAHRDRSFFATGFLVYLWSICGFRKKSRGQTPKIRYFYCLCKWGSSIDVCFCYNEIGDRCCFFIDEYIIEVDWFIRIRMMYITEDLDIWWFGLIFRPFPSSCQICPVHF